MWFWHKVTLTFFSNLIRLALFIYTRKFGMGKDIDKDQSFITGKMLIWTNVWSNSLSTRALSPFPYNRSHR